MSNVFLDPQADDQKLLAQVIDHYHHTLKESPAGQNYLLSAVSTTRKPLTTSASAWWTTRW